MPVAEPLLTVQNLTFQYGKKTVIDDVNFQIYAGETFGVVGESGSGKTTLVKLLLRLLEPQSGSIHVLGEEVTALSGRALLAYRQQVQVVFQDPYGSINPWMTVGMFVGEPLRIRGLSREACDRHVANMLPRVGLSIADMNAYPHRFSGGQRQRMAIARALITVPRFLLCDEPVSALDVSIQSQILNLFKSIQEETGLTYLFVSHNLAVIRQMADLIGVMYNGRLVEIAEAEDFFTDPYHPYSKLLLQAVPIPDPTRALVIPPDLPEVPMAQKGCAFYSRCAHAMTRCYHDKPPLRVVGRNRKVACHLFQDRE